MSSVLLVSTSHDRPMSASRTEEFADLLRRLSVMFARIAGQHTGEHENLSKHELHTIDMLGIRGPSRMGAIAQHLGVVRSAVTQLVDRLEERGIVERVRSDIDRRVWLITLTETGDAVFHGLDASYRAIAERMIAPLSDREQEQLISLLGRMETGTANPH